ncbi:hypothetical protein AJE_17165 [Alishewanella jeotgali KCTC 22429]|uniref:Uncharacterized protein n=2 Tax=Alishewanella jeotgali TaxID=545533 RepID=H3ZJ67_9ALTE|nr:hypothetical protein AJE_17165 [Alishewanella jeotgali KCTC 22429]
MVFLILALALSGCASTQFQVSSADLVNNQSVKFIDQRSEISIKGGKVRLTDAHYYHSDQAITPSKLLLLNDAITKHFGAGFKGEVIIQQFDVIDYYAKRLRGAQSASIASIGVFSPTDWNGNDDFILCNITIVIEGEIYSSTHATAYRLTENKMVVYQEESYKNAVKKSIEGALSTLFSS